MRDVRKKLILANVLIEEYKKWQQKKQVPDDKIFDGFSTTLLMKLLYLSCLYSIKEEEKTYRNTPFGVLDKWIALPKGPAEDDIYSAIGYQYMPTISYDLKKPDCQKYSRLEEYDKKNIDKINRFYYENDTQNYIKDNDEPTDVLDRLIQRFDLSTAKKQLEFGFDELMKNIGEYINVSTDEKTNRTINFLSKLSHLILWNAALNRDAKILATDNIHLLRGEQTKLNDILPKA